MVQFQHAAPELAENPLPPVMPGETPLQTPLHRLRLRQLQDLAKAYDIALPDGGTKNDILPILVTAERAGTFRQPPKSRYHLLHAEINHDQKLEPHVRAAREQMLAQAEQIEARKAEPDLAALRVRAKELGINSFGKSHAELRDLVLSEEARRAGSSGEAA